MTVKEVDTVISYLDHFAILSSPFFDCFSVRNHGPAIPICSWWFIGNISDHHKGHLQGHEYDDDEGYEDDALEDDEGGAYY